MEAVLVYNSNAGGGDVSADELQQQLRKAGYDPVYCPTDNEHDLNDVLRKASGLVVIAGGDGTIRAVALRLLRRRNALLALLPLGTANNICNAFALQGMKISEIIEGLPDGVVQPFDIGRIRGPEGTHYFLESFGCGLLADLLEEYQPDNGKSMSRSMKTMLTVLPGYQPHHLRVWLDGKYASGPHLLLEVLNTARSGPRLKFAPTADPGDGLLDVVRVMQSEQHGLMELARWLMREELSEMSNVFVTRQRRVRLHWVGFPLHVDGIVLARPEGEWLPRTRPVTIDILPGALNVLVPARAVARQDGG